MVFKSRRAVWEVDWGGGTEGDAAGHNGPWDPSRVLRAMAQPGRPGQLAVPQPKVHLDPSLRGPGGRHSCEKGAWCWTWWLRSWGCGGLQGLGAVVRKGTLVHPHHTHDQQPTAERTHCLPPGASVGPQKGMGGAEGVFCSKPRTPLL